MTESELIMFHVGQYLRRRLGKVVLYNYNGVILPKIPTPSNMQGLVVYYNPASKYYYTYASSSANLVHHVSSSYGDMIGSNYNGIDTRIRSVYAMPWTKTNWLSTNQMNVETTADFSYVVVTGSNLLVWSSHDIIDNSTREVYFAGSTPIPVKEGC